MSTTRIAFSHLRASHITSGLFLSFRERHWHCAGKVTILSVAIYLATFTFASGSVHWDHRSPFEFIICIRRCRASRSGVHRMACHRTTTPKFWDLSETSNRAAILSRQFASIAYWRV